MLANGISIVTQRVSRRNWARLLLPTIADLLFVNFFLFLLFVIGDGLLRDGDTGYHIRTGEFILRTRTIPKHDIFSFISPPLPWTAHEWLSEVIMALVHQAFGLTGIVIVFSLVISLTSLLLFQFMRTHKGDILLTVFVVGLVTISASLHWLARPHIFSLLLTVVWYQILDSYHYKQKNLLCWLPPLMLLWVNLHGGFMFGFLLLGLYLLGNLAEFIFPKRQTRETAKKKLKLLTSITAVSLLFSFINPFGYHILLFPFKFTSDSFLMSNVVEFLSPNFHGPLPFKYLFLLTIAVLAVSGAALNAVEATLTILLSYMALYSARYIPLFAVVMAPILLRQMEIIFGKARGNLIQFIKTRSKNIAAIDQSIRGGLWPVIAIVAVYILATSGYIKYGFDESKMPVAAVDFLRREHLKGNMFSDDEFGDYVIYAAWPEYKVFIDGRSDMYGSTWGGQYLKVVTLQPDWEKVIEKNNITWVFSSATSPLSSILLEKKSWHLVYADKVANIFVKKISQNHFLVEKYPDVKPVVS
jgi:hypothetical protein